MIRIVPNWHPILVHFTIALLASSTLLFLVRAAAGRARPLRGLETAASWNLWLGAAVTALTVAAGLYAAATVPHDEPAHLAMADHEAWALTTAATFVLLALWNGWRVRRGRDAGLPFVVLLVVASAGLAGTGLRGADLVFGHGLGVAALPDVTGAGHSHAAAATPPRAAGSVPSAVEAEVIAALEAYHAALSSGNVAAVERMVTPDDGFTMIEGSHTNQGWADYRDHHLSGELGSLKKIRFRLTVNRVQLDGGLAYVSFGFSILPKEGPERDFGHGFATAVLVRTDGGWKMRHLHTS